MSARQRAVLLVAAVAVAVVAFVALRPEDEDTPERAQQGTPRATPAAPPGSTDARPPAPEVQTVRVRGGEPVGGIQTIEVERGDTVRFRVRTETPQEVHLHGYDLIERSSADRPAEFRLVADEAGIFEIELERTHTRIAELKVEP